MFTIPIILAILKKTLSGVFSKTLSIIWKYKYLFLVSAVTIFLYIRGNNYKDDYTKVVIARNEDKLQYQKDINDIRIANVEALRVAKEKSFEDYKALVEKTNSIQEKYNEKSKAIDSNVAALNSSNSKLYEQIKHYTTANSNSSGNTVSDSANAYRLSVVSGLLETCIGRKQYYAEESAKLSNSVTTLQEWGNAVIEQSKQNEQGIKGE